LRCGNKSRNAAEADVAELVGDGNVLAIPEVRENLCKCGHVVAEMACDQRWFAIGSIRGSRSRKRKAIYD